MKESNYKLEIKRPKKPGKVEARTGVRFFDATVAIDKESSIIKIDKKKDSHLIILVLYIPGDIFEKMVKVNPNIAQKHGRDVGHIPGTFAFAELLIEDSVLFVSEYQSNPYATLSRDKALIRNGAAPKEPEPFLDRCLSEYKDWSKIMLLSIQDYARYLGYIKKIYIGDIIFQQQKGIKNFFLAPNYNLLRRLYKELPQEFCYKYKDVSLTKGRTFFVDDT